MRTAVIALALVLGACATAPQPDPAARHARLVAEYGPRCAQVYKEWSANWTACVDGYGQQEAAQRRAAAAAILLSMPPPALAPAAIPQTAPSLNCQTVNYGGIIQTRCQ